MISVKPWTGYDYDTMSADLHELIEELDLDDVTIADYFILKKKFKLIFLN